MKRSFWWTMSIGRKCPSKQAKFCQYWTRLSYVYAMSMSSIKLAKSYCKFLGNKTQTFGKQSTDNSKTMLGTSLAFFVSSFLHSINIIIISPSNTIIAAVGIGTKLSAYLTDSQLGQGCCLGILLAACTMLVCSCLPVVDH